MPRNKTHELFLPWPEALDQPNWPVFLLQDAVVKRYEAIAHDTHDDTLVGFAQRPYEPLGQGRGSSPDGALSLKAGDLLYFDAKLVPHPSGTSKVEITKVSLSAIWRSMVGEDAGTSGNVHAFFGGVDDALLPYQMDKTILTASETMFGFATDRGSDSTPERNRKVVAAFASRVAFSFGEGAADAMPTLDREVLLKPLMSPKPPSPDLYFRPVDESVQPPAAALKEALRPDSQARPGNIPQGRKFYLHHSPIGEPWKTANTQPDTLRFKAIAQPIAPGGAFTFTVRFDALSLEELGVLLYALRPSEAFRHKIGMGKPIGLGTIQITPEHLEVLDRRARYAAEDCWNQQPVDATAAIVPLRDQAAQSLKRRLPTVNNALLLIGESTGLRDVSYPLTVHQVTPAARETENFHWFMNNRETRQVLAPITATTTELPRLRKNDVPP